MEEGYPRSRKRKNSLGESGARAREGRQAEFELQFEQLRSSLKLIARQVLQGEDEIEEAIQKCYTVAAGQRVRFECDGEFRSWLVRALLNDALMILREKQSGSEMTGEQMFCDGG